MIDLDKRERLMLQLLVDGFSNREVASQAGLTEGTCRVYLHNLYKKLGVSNKTQAAMKWLEIKGKDIQASRDEAETFLRSRYAAMVGVMLAHIAKAKSHAERDHWIAELQRNHNQAVEDATKQLQR